MKKNELIGLMVLLISLVACNQTTQKNINTNIPRDWKVLNETDYLVQYPDSFEVNTSGRMGMNFILLSKKISQQDLFRENINLMIQDLSGLSIDLDKYVEISEGQIKTMITNGNIIESKRIKDDDSEFQKIVYTGVQGQFNLKFEQYYRILKGKAYILTLTCEMSQFDKYNTVGEKIMSSFKLKQ